MIQELRRGKKPTIYNVLPLRQYLINRWNNHPDDERVRVRVLQYIHHITTLLHSSFRNFDVNPSLHDKAINLVKNEITKRQSSTATARSTVTTITTTRPELNPQSASASSILFQYFDLLKPYQELDEYMILGIQRNEADDILLFWLARKSKFPTVFSIAQNNYAVHVANVTMKDFFHRQETQPQTSVVVLI